MISPRFLLLRRLNSGLETSLSGITTAGSILAIVWMADPHASVERKQSRKAKNTRLYKRIPIHIQNYRIKIDGLYYSRPEMVEYMGKTVEVRMGLDRIYLVCRNGASCLTLIWIYGAVMLKKIAKK
jgi:hypothetical protein